MHTQKKEKKMSQAEIQKIVWSLNSQNPPASWQPFIKARNASVPVHPPIPDDLAFVVFLSWLRERGVSFADIDLAAEPTISLTDLHPVVAKHVLIVRSSEFQRELKKFTNLVSGSYPADNGTPQPTCSQVDPSTISQRAKLPAPPSDPNYFRDPPLSISPHKLAQWGSQMTWPLSELLQWGRSEVENQASCNMTDEFLNSVLKDAIAFAAKDAVNRKQDEMERLYQKCRVPAMQAILQYFGFRVYPLEPRVLMFARLLVYMAPFSDPDEDSIIKTDEDWKQKAIELDIDLGGPKQYANLEFGDVASAWIRLRKKIGCGNASGCPTSTDVHLRINTAVSRAPTAATAQTPPATLTPPPPQPPQPPIAYVAPAALVANFALQASQTATNLKAEIVNIMSTRAAFETRLTAERDAAAAEEAKADTAFNDADSDKGIKEGLLRTADAAVTAGSNAGTLATQAAAKVALAAANAALAAATKAKEKAIAEKDKKIADLKAATEATAAISALISTVDGAVAASKTGSDGASAAYAKVIQATATTVAEKEYFVAAIQAEVATAFLYEAQTYRAQLKAIETVESLKLLKNADDYSVKVDKTSAKTTIDPAIAAAEANVAKAETFAVAALASAQNALAAVSTPVEAALVTAKQNANGAQTQLALAESEAGKAAEELAKLTVPPPPPPKNKFEDFEVHLAGLTRYKVHPKQEALDEALDKGMLVPLKMNAVPDAIARNFAAAFMLGGHDVSREPGEAIKARCIRFLERFVFHRHFLLTWLLLKGYPVDDRTNDRDMYKAYVLHQACEQGGVGDPCNLAQILARAKDPVLHAAQVYKSSLLLQVPNSGMWMRVEPAGQPDSFKLMQAIGSVNRVPGPADFNLSAVVRSPLAQLLDTLRAQRFEIKLEGM